MRIEAYIRAVGTQGTLVDAVNMPAAVNPPTAALGMSADLRLHFFQGDESEPMSAEDFADIGAWRLSVDEDYNQSTEPILRYTSGITVDEDGTVIVSIPNVSSAKLITALGTRPSGEYIAELMGYAAGEAVPAFVIQFPLNVLNRIDLEGGSESVAIDGNYYTNSQVEALLAAEYVFSFSEDGESWHGTQTGTDVYFRIKNSAVAGAQWSDPIHIPQGADGADGQDGTAATIEVGTVSEGESVTVTNSGTSTAAVFDFTFPQTIQVISTLPTVTAADNGKVYLYIGEDGADCHFGDILLISNGTITVANRGCRCSEEPSSSSSEEPSSSSEETTSSSSSEEPSSSSEEPTSSSSSQEPSSSSEEPSSSSSEEPSSSSSSTDPTKGILRVNVTGISDASRVWSIDNGTIWHDGNTSVQLNPGVYNITFKPIDGYVNPGTYTEQVEAGQTTTITGAYYYLPSSLTVATNTGTHGGTYSLINSGVTMPNVRYYCNNSLYGYGYYLYWLQSDIEGQLWVISENEQGSSLIAYAYMDGTQTPDQVSWTNAQGGTITVTEA